MPEADLIPVESIYRRAALTTWVSGAVLLLLSTCCVGSLMAAGAIPFDELRRQMSEIGEFPEQTWDQLRQVHPYFTGAAIVFSVLTMLPAVVMLILGFAVRKGKRGSTRAAWVLIWAALILVGINLLLSLPAVATSGLSGVLNLLPSVAVAALLWWTVRWLKAALDATPTEDEWHTTDADPWDLPD